MSALSALIILVGHYFPWPRKMHRPEAYSYGIIAIMVPYSVVCIASQWYAQMIVAWCLVAAAGFATLTAYAYDWAMRAHNTLKAVDGERHEARGD
jgi:Na+/melibiose symporter-like transporter